MRAVDIYCSEPYSPVDGRVVLTKQVRYRNGVEHVIVVRGDVAVKILHVLPCVSPGDSLEAGDPIGEFHASPYFHPWTDPHMHVEVRPETDPLRCRGGLELRHRIPRPHSRCALDRVISTEEHYSLVGLRCSGRSAGYSEHGVLDGGWPHYGYGGAFHGDAVFLGAGIGTLENRFGSAGLVRYSHRRVCVNGTPVKGLGFYIFSGMAPYVKVITPEGTLSKGERVEVTF